MAQHILLKFHYTWNAPSGEVSVMEEHQRVIKNHGSCWWGKTSSISQNKADQLKAQLEGGLETWIFLYSIGVPKHVHEDRCLWYVGRLKGIEVKRPSTIEQIPEYYRTLELECYFLVTDIRPILFLAGQTPKVPGQAAMRHITLVGPPNPENIRTAKDERFTARSPSLISSSIGVDISERLVLQNTISPDDPDDLKTKVMDLQDDVIRLQQNIAELRTYKDYYHKILSTDYLFSSEKFFESWLQENMHKILPELDIVDRQPSAKWPDGKFERLDLLAVNKETKDLCIIEVKTRKRSKRSGYDQFVRYTSWAKRNKEQLSRNYADYDIKPSDSPSFIIITDYIDDEMTAICKDHGITLVHVFGGLGFEKVA